MLIKRLSFGEVNFIVWTGGNFPLKGDNVFIELDLAAGPVQRITARLMAIKLTAI